MKLVLTSTSRIPVRSRTSPPGGESLINLRHDDLSPLNACGDQFVRPWASFRPAEEIVGGCNRCKPIGSAGEWLTNTCGPYLQGRNVWIRSYVPCTISGLSLSISAADIPRSWTGSV
jgi:hypothetical protein